MEHITYNYPYPAIEEALANAVYHRNYEKGHLLLNNNSQLLIYQAPDGNIKLDVHLEDETVWLTQDHMSKLFGKAKSTINEHIKNIFADGELIEDQVMKKFGISEFQRKAPNIYNLDVIISVGYRVKSQQGTQFRIWATQRLREYIIKGFALGNQLANCSRISISNDWGMITNCSENLERKCNYLGNMIYFYRSYFFYFSLFNANAIPAVPLASLNASW